MKLYKLFTFLIGLLAIIVVFAESSSVIINTTILTTQEEVNNFNKTTILANIIISGPDILNIDSLYKLTSVKGNFTIESNPNLRDINGLLHLDSVGGAFTIRNNPQLKNIDGLLRLDSVFGNFTIRENIALENINGLSNLIFIGGGLKIDSNYAMMDIGGLSRLDSLGGSLSISYNIALTNLNGLSKIDSIAGGLRLAGNTALKNIDGLYNLNHVTGGLNIDSNYALLNINGLSKLDSVAGDLTFIANTALTDIYGLYNLAFVGGDLKITDNTSLTEFCGLYNLLKNGNLVGGYEVTGNADNPTEGDIKSGPCGAQELIEYLISEINSSDLPNGTKNSLTSSLENAEKSLGNGNNGAAVNQLEAFINKVEAQGGKKIDEATANVWKGLAQIINDLISSGLPKSNNGGTVNSNNVTPRVYSLDQNYPNPFNPVTTISYSVPQTGFVSIKVFDILGNEVAALSNEEKPAGNYRVEFNGSKFASGIYFYRMQAGNFVSIKKFVLMK